MARTLDPLAALRAAAAAEGSAAPGDAAAARRFDLSFWVEQETARTALWWRAFGYCRFRALLPNCRPVRMASWWGSPLAAAPPAPERPGSAAGDAPGSAPDSAPAAPGAAPGSPPAAAPAAPAALSGAPDGAARAAAAVRGGQRERRR
jgi:hypothetical protein